MLRQQRDNGVRELSHPDLRAEEDGQGEGYENVHGA